MGWERASVVAVIAACSVVACSGKIERSSAPSSSSSSGVGGTVPSTSDPDRDDPQPGEPPTDFDDGTRGDMYPCPDGEPMGPHVVVGHCDGPADVGCSEIGYVGAYPKASQNTYVEHDQGYCAKQGYSWGYGECPPAKKTGGGCRTPLGTRSTCQPVSTNWYPFSTFSCDPPRHERLAP